MDYRIEPLTPERIDDYIKPCLVQGEVVDKGIALKRELVLRQLDQGFVGRLLYVEDRPVGLAEALPIEIAPFKIEGANLAFLHCIWVKPEWQGRGYGKELLDDVLAAIAPRGLAVFGFDYASFMPADFFLSQGFVEIEERDNIKLLYHQPHGVKAGSPPTDVRWIPRFYEPILKAGKLVVEVFVDNHCPYASLIADRVSSAAKEVDPERIEVIVHDVTDRADMLRLSKSLGVFANGEELFLGPVHRDDVIEMLREHLERIKM